MVVMLYVASTTNAIFAQQLSKILCRKLPVYPFFCKCKIIL